MSRGNFVDANGNAYYNVDCISGAQEFLEEGSVDLIITDPPYGINGDQLHKHYNRNESFVIDGYVEIPKQEYGAFSHAWIKEAARVLKPGGQIFIVSGYTNLYHVLDALRTTDLQEINHIIWKYNFGVFTRTKFVSSHYHILFYGKPGAKRMFNLECRYGTGESAAIAGSANYQDREDVWIINREYKPGKEKNKNELPSALLTKLIQYCSNEGDLVADFFMGGFSTARVAVGLNRRFIGFELSERTFSSRLETVKHLVPGALLPDQRQPLLLPIRNQGLPWSAEETAQLSQRYEEMMAAGNGKRESIDKLCVEFERGYWSVLKALKKSGTLERPPARKAKGNELPLNIS
ncbi:MAG: site-specific DNA-methyltransferase [Candidatus Eremiobacteraeota bacterium]|nr:site-specific DNA-methyltransferase [Candidatus Eremiobacteraeota bacterium]